MVKKTAPRPGELLARRHPVLMLFGTILLGIAAALALLFVGHAEPTLYQGF